METTRPRPFTSRTRVALAIARGIAAARGDRDLTATHILLAVLRSDSMASRRLAEFGITVEKYEAGMSAMLRGDPPPDEPRAV